MGLAGTAGHSKCTHPHTTTAHPPLHPQLEKLQAAVLELGVPATEFLPVVCDISKVGLASWQGMTPQRGLNMCHRMCSPAAA